MTSFPQTELVGRGAPAGAGPARVAPHDNDAEQAVLGGILIDREALAVVRDVLVPEDFYAERHAVLYRAALALDDRGEAIDTVTLRDQLERGPGIGRAGGMDYIAELTLVVPSSASVKHYADIVIGHALRRRLIDAGGRVSRLGFDNSTPVADAIDLAEQEVFKIGQESRGSEMRNIAPVVREWWDALEHRIENKQLVTGVPTNFSKLDMLTQGLQPGELVILAARPAVGKTSFALNEMSRQSLVQRLICSEAHVDSYMLRSGQADAMAFQKIAKAMDTLTHADLWIDDSPGLAINTLRARARRMKSQHKIELIVIDYLQLMQGGRRDSRVQEVSDISSGLKAIAKELDVPVLALSQLSRAAEQRENKRPQLSDLRDSGSIEQDADVVLFLYREGMHNRDIDRGKTELIVAKNRNGPVADLDLVFIAEQTAFREPYLAASDTPSA
jgi:replicative DNA helicase